MDGYVFTRLTIYSPDFYSNPIKFLSSHNFNIRAAQSAAKFQDAICRALFWSLVGRAISGHTPASNLPPRGAGWSSPTIWQTAGAGRPARITRGSCGVRGQRAQRPPRCRDTVFGTGDGGPVRAPVGGDRPGFLATLGMTVVQVSAGQRQYPHSVAPFVHNDERTSRKFRGETPQGGDGALRQGLWADICSANLENAGRCCAGQRQHAAEVEIMGEYDVVVFPRPRKQRLVACGGRTRCSNARHRSRLLSESAPRRAKDSCR